MALQFESGVQNLVYQVDLGAGRKVIHAVLFVLLAFALAALYTFSNFQGLKDPRAMETAQLARNLATGGGLTTHCVRPLSMWRVAAHRADGDARVRAHPDLRHPPVWPTLLAAVFRLGGVPQTGVPSPAFVYGWDYVPVAVNHFFTALSALWVWLVGRKLFDRRVGLLSAGAFLASDPVWRQSLLGAEWGAAMFFTLGAVYAALWVAAVPVRPGADRPDPGSGGGWVVPLVLAALLTTAAFLTRYAAGSVAGLAVFLFIGTSRRAHPWRLAALYLALAALPATPWLARNVAACGNPFGLVFHDLLAGTYLFPGDALARSIEPDLPDAITAFYALQLKAMANLRDLFAHGLGFAGGGLLPALFGAMYLHRFVRPTSRTLRWCLLPAGLLALLSGALFGADSLRILTLLWPLAIPYAWAFLLVLLDRLQYELRHFPAAVLSVVMALTALPLLVNVLPPRTGLPYPPYFFRYAGWVSAMVGADECLTTDIPWATAWYGGKTSILLPRNIDGFFEIDRRHHKIPFAYFTTVTRDQPWVRGLSDPAAPEYSWYQVFAAGKVPANFPLTHGRFIAGSDQLILADRPRW